MELLFTVFGAVIILGSVFFSFNGIRSYGLIGLWNSFSGVMSEIFQLPVLL
ncbi:MAG: hypothetical protein LBH95_09350 [Oscillospiraceae bacterium]|jgi:hypothetical protein|nr:hypothetical protein [Oscillospiraceae bacterium]